MARWQRPWDRDMQTGRTRSGRTTRTKSRADVGSDTLAGESWCVIEKDGTKDRVGKRTTRTEEEKPRMSRERKGKWGRGAG